MKFSSTQIRELAADAHFPPENFEKVLRLRELLIEFHKHTVLYGKLVLKGGTALNLFYLDLARLSVDIDLNYIGNIDREATLKERPQIVKAVEQISGGLATSYRTAWTTMRCASGISILQITRGDPIASRWRSTF
jgi:predicted nucleotidyltransferase component of viral defense system